MSKPSIVMLDGYTVNPGDLSWDAIAELGSLAIYERSTQADAAARVANADIVVSSKVAWDEALFEAAPRLRLIALLSTGYNVVDLDAARRHGVTVCNVPAYSTPDVAQHTMALILETTNHTSEYALSVRQGDWTRSTDFTYQLDPITELAHKTIGIIGMGSIGQAVARLARAFGMEVLFFNPRPRPACEEEHVRQATMDELLAGSDIVSLHCPATPENERMVDEAFIARMKPGARLVNTARGALVDNDAVAAALASGALAWFAADVDAHEPMLPDNPLLSAPHTIITPHIAWAALEARERLIDEVAGNIAAFLDGHPRDVVS